MKGLYVLTVLVLVGCSSKKEKQYYNSIVGLWQIYTIQNQDTSYQGWHEYHENLFWSETMECMGSEGTYWIEEDSLFIKVTSNAYTFQELRHQSADVYGIKYLDDNKFQLLEGENGLLIYGQKVNYDPI